MAVRLTRQQAARLQRQAKGEPAPEKPTKRPDRKWEDEPCPPGLNSCVATDQRCEACGEIAPLVWWDSRLFDGARRCEFCHREYENTLR